METAADAALAIDKGAIRQPEPEVGIAVGEEYRRDERYPVNGDAEVVVLGGTSLFRGRIMDISVSGCYIQTIAWVRLAPDTPVEILFAVEGKVVRALAASRFVKSKVGIGFRFVRMNEDMQRKLDELIDDARMRFMEITNQTRSSRPGSPATTAGKAGPKALPIVADPAALQVVARREQERAASAPGAKIPLPPVAPALSATGRANEPNVDAWPAAPSAPPSPLIDSTSPTAPTIDSIVDDAAVAVAALEQNAAGVQASQMLEVSELSKAEETSEPLSNGILPEASNDQSEVEAQALMASAVHSFEIDEDASDVGHAEVWQASCGVGPWQLRPAQPHTGGQPRDTEVEGKSEQPAQYPIVAIADEPAEAAESANEALPDIDGMPDPQQPTEETAIKSGTAVPGEPADAAEPAAEDASPGDWPDEALDEAVSPVIPIAEAGGEQGDTLADPHDDHHHEAPQALQPFKELIYAQPGTADERAESSDGQFSVLGD